MKCNTAKKYVTISNILMASQDATVLHYVTVKMQMYYFT